MTWTADSKPSNLDTVTFKRGGKGRSFKVVVDEDGEGTDGLRYIPVGFAVTIR